MASVENPVPVCPVCHKSDQVKKLQAAYAAGVERLAPPAMPSSTFSMMRFTVIGMALVAAGVFFILVFSGNGGLGSWGIPVQILEVGLTLIAIVVALVLSLIAFQRITQGDLESQKRYPAWDHAMENYRRLSYCARDKVVFDPQQGQGKVLSEAELASLLSVDTTPESTQPGQQIQEQSPTATSH
jgi:hypothetical protein